MQVTRTLEVALQRGVHHVGGLARDDVGDDRDDAVAADRQQRQGDVVVAREYGEVRTAGGDDLAHLVQATGRFLHAGDVATVADQPGQRRRLHVDRGAALDVVEEDRKRHRLGHRSEVAIEPLLRRLVVVRVDDQRPGGACPLGMAREVDRLGGGVGTRPGDHGKAPSGALHDDLDDPLVLVVAQRRRLAGRSTGNDAVGAVGDVELDELTQLGLVDATLAERGDQRDERPLERRLAHGSVPRPGHVKVIVAFFPREVKVRRPRQGTVTVTSFERRLSLARAVVSCAVTAYRWVPGATLRSVNVVPGTRTVPTRRKGPAPSAR